jgi:hypothetical protein
MERPMALRLKYGFNRVHKPVLDDAPWHSFDSMAAYRACVRKICQSIWASNAHEPGISSVW